MLYHFTPKLFQNYSNKISHLHQFSNPKLLYSTFYFPPLKFTKFHSILRTHSLHKIIIINHRVRKKLIKGCFSWKKNRGGGPRQGVDYRVLRFPRPSLPLSCQRSSFFLFFSSRQARRGVCFVAALSTTVAKATPLPRWAFRARFHPFVARIPLVHTRDVAVCVCMCTLKRHTKAKMLKIRLERK